MGTLPADPGLIGTGRTGFGFNAIPEAGGLWQGLNQRTGVVASAVWINGAGPRHSIVFVDIDGEPLTIECEVP